MIRDASRPSSWTTAETVVAEGQAASGESDPSAALDAQV